MSKKNIIENALISAEELEEAAMDNAKEVMLEAFSPEFTSFFKSILSEGEEVSDDEDEFEVDEIPDGELEEGSEHDSGKDPDAGRDSTDPSEEAQNEGDDFEFGDDDEKEEIDEQEDDGLPGNQEKIDIDDDGDVDAKDLAALRAGKKDDDVVNEEFPPKKDDEEESSDEPAPEKKEAPAPEKEEAPEEKSEEPAPESSDEEDEGDEEMEVPEELFDDEEDEAEESSEDGEDDIKLSDDLDEDDEELDFDIQDDSDESEVTDTDEFDVEGEDDEIEEGLYIRKEGEFTKITPAEYLNIRKSELEEENAKLGVAISALEGQLSESNLFNAKLANVNKLFESGIATKNQKATFVQKIDECDSIDETNTLYESTMKDMKADYNPLDSFNELLAETRNKKAPENIFESDEMIRMKRMAGIDTKS